MIVLYGSSFFLDFSGMELPATPWKEVIAAIALNKTMEATQEILSSDEDTLTKQSKLRKLIDCESIDRKPFDAIFTDCEDGEDSEVLKLYEEVWQAEISAAKEEAVYEVERHTKNAEIEDDNISVISSFVKARSLYFQQKFDVEAKGEHEDEDAKKAAMDLASSLEATMKEELAAVTKAKKISDLSRRKELLNSPKRRKSENSPEENDIENKRARLQSPVDHNGPRVEAFDLADVASEEFANNISSVRVRHVLDSMLPDATVSVKILHTSYGLTKYPPSPRNPHEVILYTFVIGCSDEEYLVSSKGEVAYKAKEAFENLAGQVVQLSHIGYSPYSKTPQLALLPNFEVAVQSTPTLALANQKLKRISFDKVVDLKDKEKVNLVSGIIQMPSEIARDRNGDPYRKTRIADSQGRVIVLNIWGELSLKPEVWEPRRVVQITAAQMNRPDSRLDLRNSSEAYLAEDQTSIRLPTKLNQLVWGM